MTKELPPSGDNPLFEPQTFNWLRQRNEASKEPIPKPTLFDTAHDAIQEKLAASPTTLYVSPEWQGNRNGFEGTYRDDEGPSVKATVCKDGVVISVSDVSMNRFRTDITHGFEPNLKKTTPGMGYRIQLTIPKEGSPKVSVKRRETHLRQGNTRWISETDIERQIDPERLATNVIENLTTEDVQTVATVVDASSVNTLPVKRYTQQGGKPRNFQGGRDETNKRKRRPRRR